jgi:hypothetical protein
LILSLQILVFNTLNITGYINPYIYPLIIILLPFDIAGWLLLVLSASVGLFIDLFTGTLGLHLFSLVLMGGLRPSIVKFLSLDRFDPDASINVKQYGLIVSIVFLSILFSVHHFSYFIMESFSHSGFGHTLLRATSSAFVSIIFSVIILLLFYNSKKYER